MKIIGITGGIGSGKTTVCNVFASLGAPVFNADQEALGLYETDHALIQMIEEQFGSGILLNGKIDRKALADVVFKDEAALKKLNSIVHPAVALKFKSWLEKQRFPYVIREAAILIESGSYKDCDHIILVSADQTTRVSRVMSRSSMTESEVLMRISRQMSDEQRLPYCDHVIRNDGKTLILPDIISLHQSFTA